MSKYIGMELVQKTQHDIDHDKNEIITYQQDIHVVYSICFLSDEIYDRFNVNVKQGQLE